MVPAPSFNQLSIISDLHMGGLSGFQIFDQGALLEAYVDDLCRTGAGECALLINGDTVDFLAEPGARYLDPEGAIKKLDRISQDAAFSPVWEALHRFVGTPKRHLILTLGNHDLELALPWVRDHLLNMITGGEVSARNRVTLAFDGAGFACNVGSSSVLCLHGNEVDPWNVTDYEALRRLACDLIQRRSSPEWKPNAGTKLVIDVMNGIKQDHAFVDLLKPEKEGALRILAAMRPDLSRKLSTIFNVAARRAWDGVGRRIRFLGTPDDTEADLTPAFLQPMANDSLDPNKLLEWVEFEFKRNTDPFDLVLGDTDEQLGSWSAAMSALTGRPAASTAWQAVKELATSTTFDVHQRDVDFDRLDALAGAGFDYVVAGHTHLARILGRMHGGGLYYNTGTWATMMRLMPQHLESVNAFQPVFERLRSSKSVRELHGLTFRRPTVVTIIQSGSQTEAALEEVSMHEGKVELKSLGECV